MLSVGGPRNQGPGNANTTPTPPAAVAVSSIRTPNQQSQKPSPVSPLNVSANNSQPEWLTKETSQLTEKDLKAWLADAQPPANLHVPVPTTLDPFETKNRTRVRWMMGTLAGASVVASVWAYVTAGTTSSAWALGAGVVMGLNYVVHQILNKQVKAEFDSTIKRAFSEATAAPSAHGQLGWCAVAFNLIKTQNLMPFKKGSMDIFIQKAASEYQVSTMFERLHNAAKTAHRHLTGVTAQFTQKGHQPSAITEYGRDQLCDQQIRLVEGMLSKMETRWLSVPRLCTALSKVGFWGGSAYSILKFFGS